ncbi:Isoflavone 7-O-glucosyltransferase 1 [Spatholobus suberectus]|nr:Isoflavone 7-O-glucosyltransferase 1 [Spatholobus suberectus]
MEVALWMHESVSGIVAAIEVEERVKELMQSDRGKFVRKRVMVAKNEAEAALRDDGSSRVALYELLKSWKSQVSHESVK